MPILLVKNSFCFDQSFFCFVVGSMAGNENDTKELNTVFRLYITMALSIIKMHIFPGLGYLISYLKHFETYLYLIGQC